MKKIKAITIRTATTIGSLVATPAAVFGQGQQIEDGIEAATPQGAGGANVNDIVRNVVNVLLWAVGIASVIMLIVGGIRYVVSAGDQNAVQGAKNTILYAIVGLVVAFLAFALINFVIEGLLGDGTSSALPS